MKNFKQLILPFIICLSLAAFGQEMDTRMVGDWVSSSGAKIKIDYANEDTTQAVSISINGGAPIRASLEGADMDSIIMRYRTEDGSVMRGFLNPMTREITLYEGDREYSKWTRR